jgi:hypothetical protein
MSLKQSFSKRTFLQMLSTPFVLGSTTVFAQASTGKRLPIKFIAALGDPTATSGTGAETWGIWHDDPAQRAVWLKYYTIVKAAGGFAPGNWQVNDDDWWMDENSLIMQPPEFPVPARKYLVSGDREVVTTLIIHPKDENGVMAWELEDKSAVLHDVTHLPCRSARYTPETGNSGTCIPTNVDSRVYPLRPDDETPAITGCQKQDYSVLLVLEELA